MKAIASDGSVKQPMSKEFLHRYDLPTPSSIKSALVTLLDKDFVYFEDVQYFVSDIFLSSWLNQSE